MIANSFVPATYDNIKRQGLLQPFALETEAVDCQIQILVRVHNKEASYFQASQRRVRRRMILIPAAISCKVVNSKTSKSSGEVEKNGN